MKTCILLGKSAALDTNWPTRHVLAPQVVAHLFPSAPHPFSKPQQCADVVPSTLPPSAPPPLSLSSALPSVELCLVPHFHVFFPMMCDPGSFSLEEKVCPSH